MIHRFSASRRRYGLYLGVGVNAWKQPPMIELQIDLVFITIKLVLANLKGTS